MIHFETSDRPILAGELAEVLARLLKTDPQAVVAAIVEVRSQPEPAQMPTPIAPLIVPPRPASLTTTEIAALRKLIGSKESADTLSVAEAAAIRKLIETGS